MAQVCALATLASVGAADTLGSEHECLYLDDEHVAVFEDKKIGYWVDDGELLLENWETGMGVREMIYCTEKKDGIFLSLQLTVGNEEKQFSL